MVIATTPVVTPVVVVVIAATPVIASTIAVVVAATPVAVLVVVAVALVLVPVSLQRPCGRRRRRENGFSWYWRALHRGRRHGCHRHGVWRGRGRRHRSWECGWARYRLHEWSTLRFRRW